MNPTQQEAVVGNYHYGFHDPEDDYVFRSRKGLDTEIVSQISEMKKEPQWMRQFRLDALETFLGKPTPTWGGDLSQLDYQDIYYSVKVSDRQEQNWDDVPDDIRKTYAGKQISPRNSAPRRSNCGAPARKSGGGVYFRPMPRSTRRVELRGL